MNITYAVADIGTNSVRLMLADEACRPVKKYLTTTRIGEALHRTRRLSPEGAARTLEALKAYKSQADHYGVELWAFATSAVRDAENRQEFLSAALSQGIAIHVVSGQTEGMLGFLGVGVQEPMTLIDIGGGSTEIAYGENGSPQVSFSCPVGCVRALDRFGGDSSPAALSELKAWLRNTPVTVAGTVQSMGQAMAALSGRGRVYAVSGTATSIASLIAGATDRHQPEKIQGMTLDRSTVEQTVKELAQTPVSQLCSIPVLGKRGDLIAYGGALLLQCMDSLSAEAITISDSDNLEGYLRYRLSKG